MSASPGFPQLPETWSEESFKVLENKVFVRLYRKKKISNGKLLFLVHGHGEQSNRYEHFPFYLDDVVDAVACVDLPGHGVSEGKRGFIQSFEDYTNAVVAAYLASQQWMTAQCGKCQSHWFGHSLGGLVTLCALSKNSNLNLNSVTTSAPLLDLAFKVNPIKKFVGELIEPIWGSLAIPSDLDPSFLSHDPSVAVAYKADPLNHSVATPRFFVNMTKASGVMRENPQNLNYNFFLMTPLLDQIVSWKAQFQFFKNLTANKKKFTSFPGFCHEAFNELEKGLAFNALADWIRENDYSSAR